MTINFSDLQLSEPIQKAVKELGYLNPTPIQEKSIPHLLEGRDLLGCAQTGTGKTAAFALPILNKLSQLPVARKKYHTKALVLTPTRELAIQIHDNFVGYGKYLNLKSAVIFGGVSQGPQVQHLSKGVDILIATPGRLLDLIDQRFLSLSDVEIFVLDEADRMLDMGFLQTIKDIIRMLPPKRQNLFFSATMPKDITQLANGLLKDPIKVEAATNSSTADLIDQAVMYVDKDKKKSLLRHLLQDRDFNKVIVFTRTKHGANKVVEVLEKNKISAEAIHSNKSQNARQRSLENFRAGRCRVLVATDIAARGIDIDDISHVINYEVPNIAESYVHRIGRTARAGASGMAISFCDAEEKSFIRDIEKLIGKPIQVVTNHPYHSETIAKATLISSGKAKALIESSQNRRPGSRFPRRGKPKSKNSSQRFAQKNH